MNLELLREQSSSFFFIGCWKMEQAASEELAQ